MEKALCAKMHFAATGDQKIKLHENNYEKLLGHNWNIKQPFKIMFIKKS